MGSTDKFCLRWNDFESNVSGSFKDLRVNKEFFDVSLTVEGDHVVQAHKVILAACSPFFRNILHKQSLSSPFGHIHPMIYLRGISIQDLKYVLDFMYHGQVNVAQVRLFFRLVYRLWSSFDSFQDDLNSFLAVAEDLQIKGLTQNEADGDGVEDAPAPRPANQRPKKDENGGPPAKRKKPSAPPAPAVPDQDDDSEVTTVKSEPNTSNAGASASAADDFGDQDFEGENYEEAYHDDSTNASYDDQGNPLEPTPGTSDGSKGRLATIF